MGLFRKKTAPVVDFGAYASTALRQAILAPTFESLYGEQLSATDGMLYEYREDSVDWEGIWRGAAALRPGIPPFAHRAYWPPIGPGGTPWPILAIAFFGTAARLRVARDPRTPDTLLTLMATNHGGDPELAVRAAAAAAAGL